MARKVEMILDYQNYIDRPPVAKEAMYSAATSNDNVTIQAWRQIWIDNIKANKEHFGSFKEHGIGQLFGKYKFGTAICAGSGPSLGYNGKHLSARNGLPLISCLHNFHFMEDNGVAPDFYVSLDAGEVVLEEVSEGGSKTPEEYWEMTKDRTLVAFIGSHPDLFKKWKGKVYLYNAPMPDADLIKAINDIEVFSTYLSTGGNVLGACLYLAKGIFGAHRVAFVGADFCFGYDKKSFHPWSSKYDMKLGNVVPVTDVFGVKCPSWPSYRNFKQWFDYLSLQIPGNWMINCSEGGCLGSYPEGNISSIVQMPLIDFMNQLNMCEEMRSQSETPEVFQQKILF